MEHDMQLTVDVEEAAARLPELLAEVKAGRDVLITSGSEPLAELSNIDKETDARLVIAQIRARRRELPRTTMQEILQWRDEDRR